PISANRYWASRVVTPKGGKPMAITYVTPEAKAYREQIGMVARQVGVLSPLKGRVMLYAQLYPHRPLDWERRMRKLGELWDDSVQCIDLGNAEKVASDALQGTVISNDCMFRRIILDRMEPDAHGARLVVRVKEVEPKCVQATLPKELFDECEVPF
ncbi:MAG TPA: RusA family crossover junction endodeoxyribonuclease, partial [Burkholderiaceae bacterium]|nr:RusA family crossover junction endodeoxyribonuclease [Burkholderiaceae bacterium]